MKHYFLIQAISGYELNLPEFRHQEIPVMVFENPVAFKSAAYFLSVALLLLLFFFFFLFNIGITEKKGRTQNERKLQERKSYGTLSQR